MLKLNSTTRVKHGLVLEPNGYPGEDEGGMMYDSNTGSLKYRTSFGWVRITGTNDQTDLSNTFLGDSAGLYSGTGPGIDNIFIGQKAGLNTSEGERNIFLGNNSGFSNIGGFRNIMIGHNAGYNNNANRNIFIGDSAGYHNSDGFQNVFVGFSKCR